MKAVTRRGRAEPLDELYLNPEYDKQADHLIGLIRDRIVREKKEEPTKEKILEIANKILENRL